MYEGTQKLPLYSMLTSFFWCGRPIYITTYQRSWALGGAGGPLVAHGLIVLWREFNTHSYILRMILIRYRYVYYRDAGRHGVYLDKTFFRCIWSDIHKRNWMRCAVMIITTAVTYTVTFYYIITSSFWTVFLQICKYYDSWQNWHCRVWIAAKHFMSVEPIQQ